MPQLRFFSIANMFLNALRKNITPVRTFLNDIFLCTTLPNFILLICSVPVVSRVESRVWLRQKAADLDLQCFQNMINPGSAG